MKNGMAIAIALGLSATLSLPVTAQAQRDDRPGLRYGEQVRPVDPPVRHGQMMHRTSEQQARRHIEGWPQPSRETAIQMLDSYGAPDEITSESLIWRNNGPWHKSVVMREPVEHNFPFPHHDVLAQTVYFDVPVERYSDLARFDGSIILDRTKGTMTARCEMEAANFLALNLAQEIIRGDRAVSDARRYYAREMEDFMQTGEKSPLLRGLQFNPLTAARAGDPDQPFDRIAMEERGW
jgi:hypothetical protein